MTGRHLVPTLLTAAVFYFLFKVHQVLLPFILGATLAYILSPLVRLFEVQGLRRHPVVIVVFGALLSLLSWGTYFGLSLAVEEAGKTTNELPHYVERGQTFLKEFRGWEEQKLEGGSLPFRLIHRFAGNTNPLDLLSAHWRTLPGQIVQYSPSVASHLLPLMELFVLVPLIAFLIMLEAPAFMHGLLGLVSARHVEMLLNIIVEIDNSLGNYMRGLFLKSFLTGLAALVGYWTIGLDYAVQLAVLTIFMNVIPMVGPWVAIGMACLVAVFQWGTIAGIAKVMVVAVFLRLLDDGVLQVVIFRNQVNLHPLAILFAMMSGAALWGFWGLLFAMPLACMVKVLLGVIWQWYRSEYGLAPVHPAPEISHIPLI